MARPPRCLAAVAAFGAACLRLGTATSVSPLQKVIQLLGEMEAKAKSETHSEQVEYSKFQQFCTDTQRHKTDAVAKSQELMESLSAEVGKLESEIKGLSEKIAGLQETIAKSQAGIKEAKEQREKDHTANVEQIEDLAESTLALERAISVMKKQNYDRDGAVALIQDGTRVSLPLAVRTQLLAMLEMKGDGDFLTRENPEAHAYEFQSGGIIELLKKLLTEFTQQRTEAEKEEMNSKAAHSMLSQDLTDTVENSQADADDNTALLNEKQAALAETSKRLATTTTTYNDDVSYLEDLKIECAEKAKSFQEKQGLRDEEIKAIQKAVEILSSPDVSGTADKHLPAASLAQSSLAQLRAGNDGDVRTALIGFLRGQGHRLGSKRLGLLADRIATSANPFAKVKAMIKDLIEGLLKEAGAETEHKGFCDTELGTNKITRTKLQGSIDELTAKLDESQARVVGMTQRMDELNQGINELTKSMGEATTLRTSEKAQNEQTIAEAQTAQVAVANAVAVLKDFYTKAGQATAFVQLSDAKEPVQYGQIGKTIKMGSEEWQAMANPNYKDGQVDRGHKEGEQTFGETYQGQQAEVGGVLAILEVVTGDFGRLEAETEADEQEAAKSYDDFMAESKKTVAVNSKEAEMLMSDRSETEAQISSGKKDLANTQDQLLAADRYYEKLRPTCVDTGVNYADRVAAREAEIQSLQEALQILKGE